MSVKVLFLFSNLFLFYCFTCTSFASQKDLSISDLRCEYQANPLGNESPACDMCEGRCSLETD